MAHAIELRVLIWGEFLFRIETPAPFEQALTPQYLMNARNASLKIVCGIEDGAIRISDLLSQRQQFAGDGTDLLLGAGEVRNGGLGPHRPMPEQAAGDSERLSAEVKLCTKLSNFVDYVNRHTSVMSRVHIEGNILGWRRDHNHGFL